MTVWVITGIGSVAYESLNQEKLGLSLCDSLSLLCELWFLQLQPSYSLPQTRQVGMEAKVFPRSSIQQFLLSSSTKEAENHSPLTDYMPPGIALYLCL